MSETAKTVDSRGRLVLGKAWAGQHVLVEQVDQTELRIVKAEIVPKREVWLHENPEAMRLVQQGLEESRRGEVAEAPDLDAVDTSDEDD